MKTLKKKTENLENSEEMKITIHDKKENEDNAFQERQKKLKNSEQK